MDERIIQLVLYYYGGMWALNVTAYFVVAYGLYRWQKFLAGMAMEPIVRTSLKIVAFFGLARMTVGLIGVTLYETGQLSALTTILVLGMTSLLLNTSFIMLEGVAVNKEAHLVWSLPEPAQIEVKELWNKVESLKRVVRDA